MMNAPTFASSHDTLGLDRWSVVDSCEGGARGILTR